MKRTLPAKRFNQIVSNIQGLKGQKEIFLNLLQTAKEAASSDISENCPEYDKAWDVEMQLMDGLKGLKGWPLISQYIDAAEETNNIWAEEMYLRGIQDALLFVSMLGTASTTDITGIFFQNGDK